MLTGTDCLPGEERQHAETEEAVDIEKGKRREEAMKKIGTRNELRAIVNRVPDEKIPLAVEILESLICYAEMQRDCTLLEPMEDDSLLRPEFIAELKESEEAARTGNVMTLEAFLKERSR